jgi:lambda family phage tail tape measure protein
MPSKVQVVIEGQNKLGPAIDAASRSLGQLEGSLETVKKAFEAVAVAEIGRELLEFGKQVVEAEDQMYKLSQKVGVATESLSGLSYAASISGVETESFGKSLEKFNKTIGEAAMGSQQAADAFKSLHISVRDSQGQLKPTEELLSEVATRFSTMKDGVAKTTLAMQLFGRAGADMIPFLNQGAAGLQSLKDEARDLGVELDTKAARSAEEFNDNVRRLELQAQSLVRQFVDGLIPSLNEVAETIDKVGREGDKGVFKQLGEQSGQWSKKATGAVVSVMFSVNELYNQLQKLMLQTETHDFLMSDSEKAETVGRLEELRMKMQQLDDIRQKLVYPLAYNQLAPGEKSFSQKMFSSDPKMQADALNTLNQKFPARGGWGGDLESDANNKKAEQLLQARTKLREAAADRDVKVAESARRELLAQLDLEKEQGTKTLLEYFDRRKQITMKGYDDEIAALNGKLGALQSQGAKQQDGSVEKLNTLSEIARVQGEIAVKESQRDQAELQATADQDRAVRELGYNVLAIEAEVQSAKGHTADVAIAAIHREYDEKRRVLAAAGKSTDGLGGAEAAAVAGAQADEVDRKINAVFSELETQQQRIQYLVSTRQITEMQGERELNKLRSEAAEKVGGMVDDYQRLAQASGNPELIANADRIRLAHEQLGRTISQVRDTVLDATQNAFENMFSSLVTGSQSAAQAFRNFASSIIGSIAQIIAKMIALWAIEKILGFLSGPKGVATSIGGGDAGGMGGIGSGGGIGSVGMHALGGGVGAGEATIVGERGPELFVPGQSGVVFGNDKLRNFGRQGSTIYIDARGAEAGVEEKIVAGMRQAAMVGGVMGYQATREEARRGK